MQDADSPFNDSHKFHNYSYRNLEVKKRYQVDIDLPASWLLIMIVSLVHLDCL